MWPLQSRYRTPLRLPSSHEAYLSFRAHPMRAISIGTISPIRSAVMRALLLIDLPRDPGFSNGGTFAAMAGSWKKQTQPGEIDSEGRETQIDLDLSWLSRLLWHSMSVSAWKKVSGSGARYSLRVNPSSGNLHPTEIYVALRSFEDSQDGLYHYRADRHALELRSRGAWTRQLTHALEIPWASDSQLIVGLTSIFWREAWKYGERAYRYCCHDLGHAMMSVLLAARASGLRGGAVAHFSDLRLARAMGLSESDEAPMVFLVFPPRKNSSGVSILPWNRSREFRMNCPRKKFAMNCFSEFMPRRFCRILRGRRRKSLLPLQAMAAPCDHRPVRRATLHSGRSCGSGAQRWISMRALRQWRATNWNSSWILRRGTGARIGAEISAAKRFPPECGADFVALYLYVHRVHGCEPGVYRWDRAEPKARTAASRAMCSASRLFSAWSRRSREIHASPFR